jgi:ABC-type proline/glycine betaine transport system ATPase subunit
MTVARNAEFGPMVRGVGQSERRQKVEHLLGVVGLAEFRNRYPTSSPAACSNGWPSCGRW